MIYEWYKTASVSELDKALNAEGQIVMITPGRVSRMSQQVSFYLQVTEALCQTLSHAAYKDIAQLLNRMELCLYFGIRESNARIIDAAQLRRLTRQQQLRVAHIMEFCSAHPSLDSPESLTRRQKSDWLNILKSLRSLPEKSSICQQLKEQFPILQIAEGVFDKN